MPLDSIPHQELKRLCTKWQIAKLELFGSALREDFSPQSDVDIMVTFDAGKTPDLFKFMDLKEELELIFKRRVDLLTRPAIERSRNRLRKEEILTTAKVLYDKAA